MEISRRNFCRLLVAAGAGAWGLAGRVFARILPERVLQAARNGRFPGRVEPLDEAKIEQPADWLG